METEILRKVQHNYERWQVIKAIHLEGHLQETKGEGGGLFLYSKYLILS